MAKSKQQSLTDPAVEAKKSDGTLPETFSGSYVHSNCYGMSPSVREFSKAMLEAKKKFTKPKKSARNNYGKYDYSNIEDVYEAVDKVLFANNILVSHFRYYAADSNGNMVLETRLTHTPSGEWMRDVTLVIPDKEGCQSMGAALTYMRKYAVLLLCGIPCEDNDSAEGQKHIDNKKPVLSRVEGSTNKQTQYQNAAASPAQRLTPADRQIDIVPVEKDLYLSPQQLQDIRSVPGYTQEYEGILCKHYKVQQLEHLPANHYGTIMATIAKK